VGNQVARPGGTTVSYTPFDLPRAITRGAETFTFGYDGDARRIRKTTPESETLYFGELYERVTQRRSGVVEHRYHVHSPERVIAVVARGGGNPGTRYLHVDHLGSVDALTDERGAVVERRSYDPFGQRRNPEWGEPVPASFASGTSWGFTGHESDDDLGLVNMKGRLFDPRVGRFSTPDPLIALPDFGQSYNAYSYVLNNPLNFVDPSGLQQQPPEILPIRERQGVDANGNLVVELIYPPRDGPAPPDKSNPEESNTDSAKVGAMTSPFDVSTTGTASGHVPQPLTTSPLDLVQHPLTQLEGGFIAGLLSGLVPFGGVGEQVLSAAGVLSEGTPEARLGLAIGQIVGGVIATAGGLTGQALGGMASVTGIGAALGVPALAVSTGLVVGGAGNIAAGLRGLSQAMMSQGSGSSGARGTTPAAGGGARTTGTDASPAEKRAVRQENRDAHGGNLTCENCGRTDLVDPQRARGGVSRPANEAQVDHIVPKAQGGEGKRPNLRVLCPECNKPGTIPR
jgi:RHS repeat-associated protein